MKILITESQLKMLEGANTYFDSNWEMQPMLFQRALRSNSIEDFRNHANQQFPDATLKKDKNDNRLFLIDQHGYTMGIFDLNRNKGEVKLWIK